MRLLMIALLALLTAPAHAAFDGNGTFNRLYNWEADKANGINVRADRMDAEMDGFATGLSTCITKDGQTTLTNNLPMGGFRHTNVGAANSRSNYAQVAQVQDGAYCTSPETGAANAYVLTPVVPVAAYTAGQMFWAKIANTNTGSSTLNVSSAGAKSIKKGNTTDVEAGDLLAGRLYGFYYDGVNFQVIGVAANTAVASITSGTINNTVIGNVTPSAGTFTSLTAVSGIRAGSATLGSLTVTNTLTVSGGTNAGYIAFGEAAADGSQTVNLVAPTPVTSTISVTLPSAGGVLGLASADKVVLISTSAIASTTALNFTGLSSNKHYMLVLGGVQVNGTSVELDLQMSTNNGSSYDTTAGNYANTSVLIGGGTVLGSGSGAGLAGVPLTNENTSNRGITNSGANAYSGVAHITAQTTGTNRVVIADFGYRNQGGVWIRGSSSGTYSSTTPVNAFRIVPNTGSIINGQLALYEIVAP